MRSNLLIAFFLKEKTTVLKNKGYNIVKWLSSNLKKKKKIQKGPKKKKKNKKKNAGQYFSHGQS